MGRIPIIKRIEKTMLITNCQYKNISVLLSQLIQGTSQYAFEPRFNLRESKYLSKGAIPPEPIKPSY
jgi:hypothetical protein